MRLTQMTYNSAAVDLGAASILFSYGTPVAIKCNLSGLEYRTEKSWGVTTHQHIHCWLVSPDKAMTMTQSWFDKFLNVSSKIVS